MLNTYYFAHATRAMRTEQMFLLPLNALSHCSVCVLKITFTDAHDTAVDDSTYNHHVKGTEPALVAMRARWS
jgi:hypothetical protein